MIVQVKKPITLNNHGIDFEAFSLRNVPEGHKGLHGFLYGEGGAEVHTTDTIPKFHSGCSLIPGHLHAKQLCTSG